MPFRCTGVGFGAGVLLDSKDNFFIIGGVDSTLSERGELYVFQLQDPFYKHCSATGAALTSAKAGVTSVFYIQCMNNFMEPADGATFKVDIAGPVGMIPGILSLGHGKYACSYKPERVGAYIISIYVGRGGTKYQDLITGRDSETSNNVHEFEKQCSYINGAQVCKSSQARPHAPLMFFYFFWAPLIQVCKSSQARPHAKFNGPRNHNEICIHTQIHINAYLLHSRANTLN
jgi:hypothetical protein